MIEFQVEITIRCHVYEVFAFVADLENLPRWNYIITAVLNTSYGRVKAGSIFHQTRSPDDEQDLIITTFKRDRLLVVETLPPTKQRSKRSFIFQAEGTGTRLVDRWEIESRYPRFTHKYIAMWKKYIAMENLKKLKKLLETGEVTLQDGRRMTL